MTAVLDYAPSRLPEWTERKPFVCACSRRFCRCEPHAHHPMMIKLDPERACGPAASDSWNLFYRHGWECWHVERCVSCGKALRRRWQIGADCPAFRSQTPRTQAAVLRR